MTKKAEKPAEKSQDVKQAPATEPAETWNAHWNIRRRLLEARNLLRDTQLWAKFSLQRDFDAFSIHPLARGVEEVLTQVGVISSFSVTKWQKQGNTTVIEGVIQFTSVDDGETLEYPTVGEGIDDSDKGIGKAVSYARKMGLISALNLGIGADNEGADARPSAPAGPSMGGTPQQSAKPKTAEDFIQPAPNGAHASGAAPHNDTATYVLEQQGMKARAVLGKDLVRTVWVVIQNSPTVGGLDAFCEMNEKEFTRFWNDDKERGVELKTLIDSKRKSLEMAGRV